MTTVSASFLFELNFPCYRIGLDQISEACWSVYFCGKYLCTFVTLVSIPFLCPVYINHVRYYINTLRTGDADLHF